jgi:hypothetical protein
MKDWGTPNNDSISVQQNSASVMIDVLSNDNDVDVDVLNIDSFSYSGRGQVSISNQQLTYTPEVGFSGTDTIVYAATDGTLMDEAVLSIQVNSVTPVSTESGGGSVLFLSFLSFVCLFIRMFSSPAMRKPL